MYMRQVLDARDTPAQVQRLLANFEIAADKDLAISKTLTKLGPILGLMGTLIPMGLPLQDWPVVILLPWLTTCRLLSPPL